MSHSPGGGPGFVAWPLPGAAGALAGVLLASVLAGAFDKAWPPWTPLFVFTVVVLALSTTCVFSVALVGRPSVAGPHGRRRTLGLAALAVLACLLAGGRYLLWQAAPNPAAPYFTEERRWSGRYDGVNFHAEDPVVASFALVARVEPPVGRLLLVASAQRAPGKRNPGGFDYFSYLKRRGVDGQLFVAEVLAAEPRAGARQRLERGMKAGLGAEEGALVSAVTLGLKDDLGDDLKDSFSRAGMAHLLALSGLHFGVLLSAASLVLVRFGSLRVYLLLALIVGFVLLVGPSPSVVRAAVMAGAFLFATAAGVGRLEPFPVLALAALVALILQPQMLFDLSFQLSYLALLGLLTFTGPLTRALSAGGGPWSPGTAAGRGPASAGRRSRLVHFVTSGVAASFAAQLPSLSLVAGAFGSVPLFSPLINLVAIPLSALLVPLGFGAGLLGLVYEPLAWLVNRPTLVIAGALTRLAGLTDSLPAVSWSEVDWLGHLCWAVAVTALALFLRRRLRARQTLLAILLAGAGAAAAGGARPPPDVWFLDVGQGDATLIRLAGRYEVLIDAGGSPFSDDDVGERVVLPALRALGVDELELVVATHPDADHVEGLFTVLGRLPVGRLVTGPAQSGNALDDDLRALAAERGVKIHVATRGETLLIGRQGEARLEVLHPVAGGGGGSANEESVVLLLRYRDAAAVLLLADVGSNTERDLAIPRVGVLRVGHHGSRFSTSPELLRAAAPHLAVISVGTNNYGHPHVSVLRRLAEAGVEVSSTAAVGAVRLDLANTLEAQGFGAD